jgi:hypothetical protein
MRNTYKNLEIGKKYVHHKRVVRYIGKTKGSSVPIRIHLFETDNHFEIRLSNLQVNHDIFEIKEKEFWCKNIETEVEFLLTEEQYKEMEHMFEIIWERK